MSTQSNDPRQRRLFLNFTPRRFAFFRRHSPNPANPIAKIASAAGSGTGVSRNHSPTGNPFVGNWQLIFNHYHQIREQAVSCKI